MTSLSWKIGDLYFNVRDLITTGKIFRVSAQILLNFKAAIEQKCTTAALMKVSRVMTDEKHLNVLLSTSFSQLSLCPSIHLFLFI